MRYVVKYRIKSGRAKVFVCKAHSLETVKKKFWKSIKNAPRLSEVFIVTISQKEEKNAHKAS